MRQACATQPRAAAARCVANTSKTRVSDVLASALQLVARERRSHRRVAPEMENTMTNKTKTLLTIAALIAPSALVGCNRTPADAHEDAVEAQNNANEKAAEARQAATDAVNDAKDKAATAVDDARKNAAQAQAEANEKIRQANREIVKPATDVEAWAKEKLDGVDNMIDTATAKAQAAKPAAKAKFNGAMQDVQKQRDELNTELASLQTRAGTELDKSKEAFSQRIDQVKDRIRDLEKSL
jgi:predicted  nucleic acid-binding Zn-ribbon protein